MEDSDKNRKESGPFQPNRAFVPPWQLGASSATKFPSATTTTTTASARPKAPPVPTRSFYNNHSLPPFASPFAKPHSTYGLPASPYSCSSPYYGSFNNNGRLPFDPSDASNPWIHLAHKAVSPAFEGVESLVMTVRSVSVMVESTYQAIHSSVAVMMGVADHFAKLKEHLVSVISSLSLLKLFKWILDQFLIFLRLKRRSSAREAAVADWSEDFLVSDSSASSLTHDARCADIVTSKPAASHWPLIAFFGIGLGAPWLLWKIMSSARVAAPKAVNISSSWSTGVGEHFVAKAEFDFRGSADDELSFRENDFLKIAPKHLQPDHPKGWYLASKDGVKIGLVPANRVQVLVKLEGDDRAK